MRSAEQIFEDIEIDRAQREREIRLIENFAQRSDDMDEKKALYRTVVILTYAHLEGFCKFALLAYIGAINSRQLACKEAATPLVAATLNRALSALRDVNHKHPIFKAAMPDDAEVHLQWREQVFIENYDKVFSSNIEISDKVVDTKSNLNSVALKRNLYRLGLPYPIVDAHGDKINELLGRRNAIAHGDIMATPDKDETKQYVSSVFDVMKFVQNEIYEALRNEAYRRNVA